MTLCNSIINIKSGSASVMLKESKWRCEVCEFDNVDELTSCEMCQTPKKKDRKNAEIHAGSELAEKEPGIICSNKSCSHYNSLLSDVCSACKKSLFDEHIIKKERHNDGKVKLKFCYKCAVENDPMNITCVNCDIDLFQKIVIPKISSGLFGGFGAHKPQQNEYFCEDCGGKVQLADGSKMILGHTVTYEDYICLKCSKSTMSEEKLCIFCDQHLTKQETEFHDDICEARAKFFRRQDNPTFDRCSRLQIQTVFHMHKKYQKLHEANKHLLIHRIKKLGYNQKDLENLHHYIMHYAPIIIHFRVQNMTFYIKDTHYRNCFEVRGNNMGRVQWEDRMFDNKHHNASHYERVKYGTMNFTNDPKGVNACQGYGQSYFLLKPHVRDRCTITDMDSASPTATIGTFRFVFHVLMKLTEAELKAAFEGSKGKEMLSNVIGFYKQIQIHGPVQFSKDIERVYLCKQQFASDSQNLTKLAKDFCQMNKLEYESFDRKNNAGYLGYGANNAKAEKAPERILGKDEKQLNLDEEDLARAGMFGLAGGYHPKIKPIKKRTHKK